MSDVLQCQSAVRKCPHCASPSIQFKLSDDVGLNRETCSFFKNHAAIVDMDVCASVMSEYRLNN